MPVTPDPTVAELPGMDGKVVFLKPLTTSPLIEVGEYTYYADPVDATRFETENVMYHFGPEKLVIGRFCAIGTGTKFLMPASSHPVSGVSTYPFFMFPGDWMDKTLASHMSGARRGDTVVGNDVWFGREATVMPGVTIGDGAIIGTNAVVTADVPPYGVVFGNPGRLVGKRFSDQEVELLLGAAWWDWPLELITEHADVIATGTPEQIAKIAHEAGVGAARDADAAGAAGVRPSDVPADHA